MKYVTQIGTGSVMYWWLHPTTLNPAGRGGGFITGRHHAAYKKEQSICWDRKKGC